MDKNSYVEKEWNDELRKFSREFIEEVTMKDPDWVRDRRLEFLKNKKREIKAEILTWLDTLDVHELIEFADITEEMRELGKIEREMSRYTNPKFEEGITEEMILSAREYPIEDLIEVNNGFALCPFHNDKNPSAYCKNNYLYCFSCGEQADSIKLYMHTTGCTFKQAVKDLQA